MAVCLELFFYLEYMAIEIRTYVLYNVNMKEGTFMKVDFSVTKWEEQPISQHMTGFPINSVHAEYQIEGELQGKATVEYLLYYLESNMEDGHLATARTAGFLYFEGTYKGKTGTFTAAEKGIFDKGLLDSPGMIIKSTGNLSELKGSYHYQFIGQTSKLILDFKGID